MFSKKYNSKIAILIGNSLKSCKEDVNRLSKILEKYNFKIITCFEGFPKEEILKIKNTIKSTDLLYIHFSGHGKKFIKKINNKATLVSSWFNPDGTIVTSDEIDHILSNINSDIILTSDSCNSGHFGEFYNGKSLIFIGASDINHLSESYKINSKPPAGLIICLFEYILDQKEDINIDNINKYLTPFYRKYQIKKKIKIKQIKDIKI